MLHTDAAQSVVYVPSNSSVDVTTEAEEKRRIGGVQHAHGVCWSLNDCINKMMSAMEKKKKNSQWPLVLRRSLRNASTQVSIVPIGV